MSTDSSSQLLSDSFSGVTKLEIKCITQDQCWNCLASPIDVAHVVAKEDPAIRSLSQRGMINFSLTSTLNAIALCPSCHRNFDQTMDPGFIFVPSDIAYFISFEEEDFERRCHIAGEREPSTRTCPTADMYRDYQASQGVISSDAAGGLYRRIILKDFQPLLDRSVFSPLQSWHGSPMAALRRAFVALGSIRIDALPTEVRDGLRRLQELYCREPGFRCGETGDMPQVLHTGSEKRKKDDEDSEPSASKHRRTEQSDTTDTGQRGPRSSELHVQKRISHAATSSDERQEEWILGPMATSWGAAERYQSLFSLQL